MTRRPTAAPATPPRLADRWDSYWFAPGPVLDLAIVRILLVGLWQIVLFWPNALMPQPVYETFGSLLALPESSYAPLPVFRLVTLPLGAGYRPTLAHLELALALTKTVGFFALLGLFTRASLGLYLLGLLFMIGHHYSYGDYHHVETIPLMTLAVLAASPSGAALSIDAWLRRRRAREPAAPSGRRVLSLDAWFRRVRGATPSPAPPLLERASRLATWPRTLMAWMFSIVYLSAALCKLLGGGLDWMNGFTLQASMLQAALFWDVPLGRALAGNHVAMHALTWVTILFEGTFFLVLLRPRLAPLYAIAGALFHVGIQLTMNVPFALYVPCFGMLVPWTHWMRRAAARA